MNKENTLGLPEKETFVRLESNYRDIMAAAHYDYVGTGSHDFEQGACVSLIVFFGENQSVSLKLTERNLNQLGLSFSKAPARKGAADV